MKYLVSTNSMGVTLYWTREGWWTRRRDLATTFSSKEEAEKASQLAVTIEELQPEPVE